MVNVVVPDDWLADRATFEARLHDLATPSSPGDLLPPAAVFVFGKWWLRLPQADESIAPHIARDGYWESWVSLAFARLVRPGAAVVDLGAHAGWFTLLALARGAERVFAAEPQPELAALLRETLHENGLAGHAEVYGNAVGRAWAAEDLLTYGAMTGSASLEAGAAPGWEPSGRIRVGVAPLDGLLDRPPWRRVDVVKVDVEGAESAVWDGMAATLARNPQAVVLMEAGPGRGYPLPDFVARILTDGFRIRLVAETGELVPAEPEPGVLFDEEAARMVGAVAPPELLTLLVDRP